MMKARNEGQRAAPLPLVTLWDLWMSDLEELQVPLKTAM